MSDDSHDSDSPHEGPIKTPKQLVLTVLASFIVPIVVIVLMANFVAFGTKTGAGSDSMEAESVARRLQRVGMVEIRDTSGPRVLRTGEQIFNTVCSACHTSGAVGAPKVGDVAAWAPRIQTGYESLLNSVMKGKGAMTAQGGGDYDPVELGRAVVYLTGKAGANFPEPKVPEAAASAAGAAPAASAAN